MWQKSHWIDQLTSKVQTFSNPQRARFKDGHLLVINHQKLAQPFPTAGMMDKRLEPAVTLFTIDHVFCFFDHHSE
jgi:hypothetical protein